MAWISDQQGENIHAMFCTTSCNCSEKKIEIKIKSLQTKSDGNVHEIDRIAFFYLLTFFHDRMVVGFSIQHYVKKFVSDLQHKGGFLWYPPLTTTI